jgi:hypothetical protein
MRRTCGLKQSTAGTCGRWAHCVSRLVRISRGWRDYSGKSGVITDVAPRNKLILFDPRSEVDEGLFKFQRYVRLATRTFFGVEFFFEVFVLSLHYSNLRNVLWMILFFT